MLSTKKINQTTLGASVTLYCPNCSAGLERGAVTCWNCSASFGKGSAWEPVDRPSGVFREILKIPVSDDADIEQKHQGIALVRKLREVARRATVIDRRQAAVGTVLALILYFASLWQPAFEFANRPTIAGLLVLQIGWAGILMLDPRWYANVLFVLLCIFNSAYQRTPKMALVTICFGIGTLALPIYFYPNEGTGIRVHSLGLGGWLWVIAISSVAVINLFLRRRVASNPSPHSDRAQVAGG